MGEPSIVVPAGKQVRVEITPLTTPTPLFGRVHGICGAESTPGQCTDLISAYMRPGEALDPSLLSQAQLIEVENQMREAALTTNDHLLLGLRATPAIEEVSGRLNPILAPGSVGPGSSWLSSMGGLGGGGIYQLMSFPIARFNGIPLPMGSRIRFADPGRWFSGAMESRLFTISVDGTKKYFSWDAHFPVGIKPHDFFHVNQKGMASVLGQTDHAALTGTALVQAKQLRYLKIGGRIFLVVGVVIDTVQLGAAGYESYQTGSAKPVAKQAVRTATGWAAAWAGAKAGVVAGGLAGVETGPGLVLTAIGGGLIGGVAGYFGGNWIADWLFDD